MAKRWLNRALVALLFLPAWLCAAPRVITLSPANTELAFAAGITPVAVSAYSDYPDAARKLEQVANWQGMNLERIVALKPDLLVAWRGGNPERQVNQLQSLGIKVLWLDPQNVAQIADALRALAPYSPTPETAQARRARSNSAGRRSPRVMGQLRKNASLSSSARVRCSPPAKRLSRMR